MEYAKLMRIPHKDVNSLSMKIIFRRNRRAGLPVCPVFPGEEESLKV